MKLWLLCKPDFWQFFVQNKLQAVMFRTKTVIRKILYLHFRVQKKCMTSYSNSAYLKKKTNCYVYYVILSELSFYKYWISELSCFIFNVDIASCGFLYIFYIRKKIGTIFLKKILITLRKKLLLVLYFKETLTLTNLNF